jgi:hypothetical protein
VGVLLDDPKEAVMPESMIGKVVHLSWGHNCTINDFCLVVDEAPKTLVLVKLKKVNDDSTHGQEGNEWPVVPDLDKEPLPTAGRFRATKKEGPPGPCCSYEGNDYYLWDGKPKWFNSD